MGPSARRCGRLIRKLKLSELACDLFIHRISNSPQTRSALGRKATPSKSSAGHPAHSSAMRSHCRRSCRPTANSTVTPSATTSVESSKTREEHDLVEYLRQRFAANREFACCQYPAAYRILTGISAAETSPGPFGAWPGVIEQPSASSYLRPRTTRSKDNGPSGHSRSGKDRLDHHQRILAPGQSPAAMAHPEASTDAAGTEAADPVHLPERTLA